MALEQHFTEVDKARHDLKAFDCGNEGMNQFLGRFAVKHNAQGLSRTYVLVESTEADKAPVASYYTLSTSAITAKKIPTTKSLPRYPIPVVLLARLAVDRRYQGKGLGGKTLVDALRRAVTLTRAGLPAHGLILDVLDDKAMDFYRHYELFHPFTDDPQRLFVPMATISDL